ncbi:hypothetical protein P9112_004508 [Eukaryota sp. TZLM1-RC]
MTYRVAQFSDLHFFSSKDFRVVDVFTKRLPSLINGKFASNRVFDTALFPDMLRDAHNEGTDNVLITGDLTCLGTREEFTLCRDALLSSPFYVDNTPLPRIEDDAYPVKSNNQIWCCPGNHDDLVYSFSSYKNYEIMRPFMPPEFPRVLSLGPLDVLLLNSSFGQILPTSARGKVDYNQRLLARKQLANRDDSTPLMTCLHHSPTRRTLPTHALLEEAAFEQFVSGQDESGVFSSSKLVSDYVIHGHTHKPLISKPFTYSDTLVCDSGSSTLAFMNHCPSYLIYEFETSRQNDKDCLSRVLRRSFQDEGKVIETCVWSTGDQVCNE